MDELITVSENGGISNPLRSSVQSLLVGIDAGTRNIKVAVYTPDLQLVASHHVPTALHSDGPHGEIDADDLWSQMCSALGLCLEHAPHRRVGAIGIAGMAEAGCLIAEDGRPISPVLLWYDQRGRDQAEVWRAEHEERFQRITGVRLTHVRSIAKWRWLVDAGYPDHVRWCGVPEWLTFRMCGVWSTDPTLASRTGAFDVIKGDYSSELLDIAGAPGSLFPPVIRNWQSSGSILPAVAKQLRIPTGAEVVVAGHDDVVAAAGCDAEDNDLVDSAGTAEGLVRITPSTPNTLEIARNGLAMTRYPATSSWAVVGGAGTTGALLERVADILHRPLHQLDRLLDGDMVNQQVEVRAELSSEALPDVRFDLTAPPAAVWDATLALAAERFSRREHAMRALLGAPARVIFAGGSARCAALVAKKVTLSGIKTHRVQLNEATARGAAILAGRACDM